MESSSTSIIIFSVFTLIYIIVKQMLGFKDNKPIIKNQNIFLGIYGLIILLYQYSLNSKLTEELCGVVQPRYATLYTVVPNFFMLGTLFLLFSYFPGWKAPFSNTVGYVGAMIGGVRSIFNKMMLFYGKNEDEEKEMRKLLNKYDPKTLQIINQIYKDPSLLINQFTPQNFNDVIEKKNLGGIFNENASEYYSKLYTLVTLKDCISEWMWLMLTGILVILTSHNALLDISCTQDTATMLEKHQQWEEEQNNAKPPPTPKVYKSRE